MQQQYSSAAHEYALSARLLQLHDGGADYADKAVRRSRAQSERMYRMRQLLKAQAQQLQLSHGVGSQATGTGAGARYRARRMPDG
jgi:hypothetical protein